MEQYKSDSTGTPPPRILPETKELESLQSKVDTLERFVHDQSQDILKLRREISRLKSSIDQIVGVMKSRG